MSSLGVEYAEFAFGTIGHLTPSLSPAFVLLHSNCLSSLTLNILFLAQIYT